MPKEINKQQLNKENLREEIIKRVKFEELAHYTVEDLILASIVTETALIESCHRISPEQYDDIIEERAISNLCGYPICNSTPTVFKKQYHISLKDTCVYDITKRKNFCSNHCYEASNYLRNQISSSPVWVRQSLPKVKFNLLDRSNIEGQIGEVILEDTRRVLHKELLKDIADNSSYNASDNLTLSNDVEQSQESSLKNSDNQINIISNNFLNHFGSTSDLKSNIFDLLKNKTRNLVLYLDDLSVDSDCPVTHYKVDRICTVNSAMCDGDSLDNDNLFNNKEELANCKVNFDNNFTDFVDNTKQLVKDNRLITSKHADSSSDSKIRCEQFEKSCSETVNNLNKLTKNVDDDVSKSYDINSPTKNLSTSLSNPKNIKLNRIRDKIYLKKTNKSIYISQNDLQNELKGLQTTNNKLCINSRDNVCRESHILESLKQFVIEWMDIKCQNFVTNKLKSKNCGGLNIVDAAQKDHTYYANKVLQFYGNAPSLKDDDLQLVLPNVDSHYQSAIQRQIVYKRIYSSMRCLTKIYGFDASVLLSNIKSLIKDFNFNNQNILLNPNQWNLSTLIFIKYLVERNEVKMVSSEFEMNIIDYLGKINISEKEFDELYNLFTKYCKK